MYCNQEGGACGVMVITVGLSHFAVIILNFVINRLPQPQNYVAKEVVLSSGQQEGTLRKQ